MNVTHQIWLDFKLQEGVVADIVPVIAHPDGTIIDGMALVQAMLTPKSVDTFGDFATKFIINISRYFTQKCNRVDVVFDSYQQPSINERI